MAQKRFDSQQHLHDLDHAQKALKNRLSNVSARSVEQLSSLAPIFALDEMQNATDAPKRHRFKKVLFTGIVIAGIVAFFRSSLPARLTQTLFKHDTDDEIETITLPIDSRELKDVSNELPDTEEIARNITVDLHS